MSRVYYLGRVLQKVVYSFNDVSFAQHHLVVEWHQFAFHIHPKAGDQLDAIFEQGIKKFLRGISLVCEQLTIQAFSLHIERFRIPVTNIRSSEYKRNAPPLSLQAR